MATIDEDKEGSASGPVPQGPGPVAAATLEDRLDSIRAARPGPAQASGGGAPAPAVRFPALFDEANTRRLLEIPFNLWAVWEDCEGLTLDESESRELCASAVPMLNTWVAVDPKWLSLSLFGVSLLGIVATKCIYLKAYKDAVRRQAETGRSQPKPAAAPVQAPGVAPAEVSAAQPVRTDVLGQVSEKTAS